MMPVMSSMYNCVYVRSIARSLLSLYEMHRTVSQFMRRNELEANSETLTADVTEVHALNDVRCVLVFCDQSTSVYVCVASVSLGCHWILASRGVR